MRFFRLGPRPPSPPPPTARRSPGGRSKMDLARIDAFVVHLHLKLGDGGFGAVYRAKDSSEEPPAECAAKRVKVRTQGELEAVRHEAEMLRAVAGHPSVIGLRGFVEAKAEKEAWLFMELASGTELFDRLIDAGSLTERATWAYAKALFEGIAHCHSRGVIHRDVKLENIMLCAEDPSAIKLVDFGLAMSTELTPEGKPQDVLLYDTVGTKSYRPPEVSNSARNGYLGPPVDVWSLGIVIFSLVSGFFPLEQTKRSDWRYARLLEDQLQGISACASIYAMYNRECPFSQSFREMVDRMLSIIPEKRPSAAELLDFPWFEVAVKPRYSEFAYQEEDYDEPITYRTGSLDEIDLPAFEPPAGAMKIERQPAKRSEAVGDTATA